VLSGTRDEKYLRRAIALAQQSRAGGHHPFGCVVVTDDDQILAECESRKERGGDATQHSELTAVKITSGKYPKALLQRSTLYTSTEPCAMCAGAIYWGGIGRVRVSAERNWPCPRKRACLTTFSKTRD
jgi:tRNA(adenine34) deaminase